MKKTVILLFGLFLGAACTSEKETDAELNFPHRDTTEANGKPAFADAPIMLTNDSIKGWAVETDFEMDEAGKYFNGITFLKRIDSTTLKIEMNANGEVNHIFVLEQLPSGDAFGHELNDWEDVQRLGVYETDSSMKVRYRSIVDHH